MTPNECLAWCAATGIAFMAVLTFRYYRERRRLAALVKLLARTMSEEDRLTHLARAGWSYEEIAQAERDAK